MDTTLSKTQSLGVIGLIMFFMATVVIGAQAQYCENQSLAFDGNGDNITLSLGGTAINGAGDFSVEAWFLANPSPGFQILFSLSGSSPSSLFALGLIPGGQLAVFWQNIPPSGGTSSPMLIPTNPANLEGSCYHLAVSRQGGTVRVYLDGTFLIALSVNIGPFHFDHFEVGGMHVNIPGSQDWDGLMDEIRLWSVARTAPEINGTKDCVLSAVSGLEVYWTLDQNADPGNPNPAQTVAIDYSGNANDGLLNSFLLNGTNSNFVCNPCPLRYELIVSDNPSSAPTLLSTICSGDAVHFCISENFSPVGFIPGASVVWEYSDDGGQNWSMITDPLFSGYCFGLPKGIVTYADCANSTTGFVDRKYRAKIEKSMTSPSYTCTYTTAEHDLKICCPITGSITLTPQPPFVPPVATLCEGIVTVDVVLTGPPFLGNLPIQWCIDGVHDQSFDNLTSFTYTGPANAPSLCFEAKIQNCACPPVTLKACLTVDPKPTCNITIDQLFSNVTIDPDGIPYHYIICPGGQETLGITGNYQNCVPVWQYHFDQPAGDPWKDLGASNFWQNTNTLPQHFPPNPSTSPYLWPANANCIYYRIECRPPNFPGSGCQPCHSSNELRICLNPDNLLTPVIAAIPNPICENSLAQISNTTFDLNVTQEQWYCNGLPFGGPMPPSSSITTSQAACYQLAVTDGCYTKLSNLECLPVCDPVSIIKCPEDNPCACIGQYSTFDGTMSYSNCGGIILYEWKVQDLPNGPIQVFTGPLLMYMVPPGGCTITLCVTDSNNCMEVSKPLIITPCE
jgi:hypothetical protein